MSHLSSANWHFIVMIFASILVLIFVIRLLISKDRFLQMKKVIITLSVLVVVAGMLLGKFGANWGLPWWIYYPVPMLLTLILPPLILKFDARQSLIYILLSFLSAPFIHIFFSFFMGWGEYLPFWKIPYWKSFVT